MSLSPRNAIILAALTLASLLALFGTACGKSDSIETVAKVKGVTSISKATLEHWLPVEAVVVYEEYPTKPVPKGIVPDAPKFTDCIAYLRTHPQKLTAPQLKLTTAQWRNRCRAHYQELKVLALNTLIGWYWTIGAGRALGMAVSDAEAKARLKEVNPRYFSTNAQFARYLRLTGQTLADMIFRSRVQLYEVKMLAKLEAKIRQLPSGLSPAEHEQALTKLTKNVPPSKYWVARTTCHKGYVVSACSEYRGTLEPDIPN